MGRFPCEDGTQTRIALVSRGTNVCHQRFLACMGVSALGVTRDHIAFCRSAFVLIASAGIIALAGCATTPEYSAQVGHGPSDWTPLPTAQLSPPPSLSMPPPPPPPLGVGSWSGIMDEPRQQSAIGIPQGPGYGAYVGTVAGGPNVYVIPPGAY